MTLIHSESFGRDVIEGGFLDAYPCWNAYPSPWKCTDKIGTYDPNVLSVSGGKLNVRLHTDPQRGPIVSAPYINLPKTPYGRFATRMRADLAPGFKVAILLWPWSDKWPDGGEVDWPEGDLNGSHPTGFIHHASSSGSQDIYPTGVKLTDWHIYETIWRPKYAALKLDGVEIGRTTHHIPSTPMRWMLQCETNGRPDPKVEGSVQFDWVRAYT